MRDLKDSEKVGGLMAYRTWSSQRTFRLRVSKREDWKYRRWWQKIELRLWRGSSYW